MYVKRSAAFTRARAAKTREPQDVREPQPLDLRALLLVLAERRDGIGMRDDELRVPRRAVRVHGSADRTDEREREVEQRPLDRRLPDDRDGVALADAGGEQSVRELVDGLRRL